MGNSNNNNRFISPNRFARLFYEVKNNDDNESITNNNTDSTKTLLNDQIKKILQKIIITMIKTKTLVDRK